MEDKWQSDKSFSTTNMRMLEDEILCDVTFLVGKSRQLVKAHKFILVSRSPVFHVMFCGLMAESGDAIPIPDITTDAFRHMLRYLYTGECPINDDTVLPLLYAANKYEVAGLATECKEYLRSHMAPSNVFTIIECAYAFDDAALTETCLDFIDKHGTACIHSDNVLVLSKATLRRVIQSNTLSATEEDVYSACVKWAKEECKRTRQTVTDENCRKVLGDIVELVRFPLMSLEAFTSLVSTEDILTSDEKLSLFQYFGSRSKTARFQHQGNVGNFSCTKRVANQTQGYFTHPSPHGYSSVRRGRGRGGYR